MLLILLLVVEQLHCTDGLGCEIQEISGFTFHSSHNLKALKGWSQSGRGRSQPGRGRSKSCRGRQKS